MITKFKLFEDFGSKMLDRRPQLKYEVGDFVISPDLDKYKVLKIYIEENHPLRKLVRQGIIKNDTNQPYMYVDIENVNTGEILTNKRADQFKLEVENNADKYNL